MAEPVTVVLEAYYCEPTDMWFEVNAYPSEQGLAVRSRDVTERRRMGEQLRQAQRLESIGTLAGVAGGYVRLDDGADDGTGIAEGDLARLYDPFFTTKPTGPGTGLGLSTAEVRVRNHGGFIDVDTAPGRGTTFKVHPPAPRASPCAPREPERSRLPPGQGEVALVDAVVPRRDAHLPKPCTAAMLLGALDEVLRGAR